MNIKLKILRRQIRRRIKALGVSDAEIARQCGMGSGHLSRVLNVRSPMSPRIATFEQIEAVLTKLERKAEKALDESRPACQD